MSKLELAWREFERNGVISDHAEVIINIAVDLHDENKRLREALLNMTERYCDLINSGDAGNWNPEDDQPVISARLALSEMDGEK